TRLQLVFMAVYVSLISIHAVLCMVWNGFRKDLTYHKCIFECHSCRGAHYDRDLETLKHSKIGCGSDPHWTEKITRQTTRETYKQVSVEKGAHILIKNFVNVQGSKALLRF